jgi:hypothetical protein
MLTNYLAYHFLKWSCMSVHSRRDAYADNPTWCNMDLAAAWLLSPFTQKTSEIFKNNTDNYINATWLMDFEPFEGDFDFVVQTAFQILADVPCRTFPVYSWDCEKYALEESDSPHNIIAIATLAVICIVLVISVLKFLAYSCNCCAKRKRETNVDLV